MEELGCPLQAEALDLDAPRRMGDREPRCLLIERTPLERRLLHERCAKPERRDVDAIPPGTDHAGDGDAEARVPVEQVVTELCDARGDQLGRCGRRRAPAVGGEVGNRCVGLVPDAGDHREPGRPDRPSRAARC